MPSLRVLNELQIKQNGITTIYKVGTVNGYYKTTDGKFYEEPSYITEIEGQPNLIYVDIAGDNLYIYETSTSSFRKVSKGGDSEDNIKFGYYKETDGKFYKDNQYQVEIPGNVNYIFIGLDNNTIYRYDTIENDFIDIGGEVTDYSSEINSLATINSQQTSEISSLATVNSQQTNGINSLTAVDSQQTTRINSLSTASSEQVNRINSISTSMSELAQTASSLSTENSQQTSRINSLSIENSTQTSELNSLASEVNSMSMWDFSSDVNSLEVVNSAQTSELNSLASEVNSMSMWDFSSDIDSLAAVNSQQTSEINSVSTSMSELATTANSLTTENSLQTSQLGSLNTATSELASETTYLQSEVDTKQNMLTAGTGISIQNDVISASGHIITDGTTDLTQREKLEFDAPLTLEDDLANGTTKVGVDASGTIDLDRFAIPDTSSGNKTMYIKTATLAIGNTSVTFTDIPTTGGNLITLYTDKAGLEYKTIDDSIPGEITYTFDEQESAVTCWLLIREVTNYV